MSKINILVIPPDGHGVGRFRMTGPYTHLQENYPDDFHIDIRHDFTGVENPFDKYDIVVAHSFFYQHDGFDEKGQPKQVSLDSELRTINKLKSQGKIVIIDIDDYWLPDMKHPMYRTVLHKKMNVRKTEFLKNASYITTTTNIFKKTIKDKLGLTNVRVFPNAIDVNEKQYQPNPISSDKIRFGWLGGSSHLHDIILMRNGVASIAENFKDKGQLVLCGFDLRGSISEIDRQTGQVKQRAIQPKETVWYEYEKIFTKNYTVLDAEYSNFLLSFKNEEYDMSDKLYVRRWTEPITKYATNYNYFDVSLAPLVGNLFNNNKSQLKAIEAGFHKKALIASEASPYMIDLVNAFDKGGKINSKGNALLVPEIKSHKLWTKYMKYLVENPNMIVDLGEKLHETIVSKYSLDIVNKKRADFLKSIINK